MKQPLYPTLAPTHPNKNQEEKEKETVSCLHASRSPATQEISSRYVTGGQYLAPFQRQLCKPVATYSPRGAPHHLPPLRRSEPQYPSPSIMGISPSPTTKPHQPCLPPLSQPILPSLYPPPPNRLQNTFPALSPSPNAASFPDPTQTFRPRTRIPVSGVTCALLLKERSPGEKGVCELRGVGAGERGGGDEFGGVLLGCCWGVSGALLRWFGMWFVASGGMRTGMGMVGGGWGMGDGGWWMVDGGWWRGDGGRWRSGVVKDKEWWCGDGSEEDREEGEEWSAVAVLWCEEGEVRCWRTMLWWMDGMMVSMGRRRGAWCEPDESPWKGEVKFLGVEVKQLS